MKTLGAVMLATAVLALWTAGLMSFVRALPERAATVADGPDTDAIVVLTGGDTRIETGLALLRAGRAHHLFISGVGAGVVTKDLLARAGETGQNESDLTLGRDATDTIGNARETAQWVAKNGYRSLRLVTAAYHMPRSLAEFRAALPRVEIVAHPVFPQGYGPARWRPWRTTGRFVVAEYHKFVLSQIRLAGLDAWNRLAGDRSGGGSGAA